MLRVNHPRSPSQWKRLAIVYTTSPTTCGELVPLESQVVSRCHKPELLVHPNTEVRDVDDDENPPPPVAKPQATAPWRRAPTHAIEAEAAPKPRARVNPPPPKRTRVVFASTSRVVLRPGPGASQETAPSAEPSFAEHTRGTVPMVARRVVAEYDSGEPPAQSPSRTSVTVTPLVDPTHRTPNRNWTMSQRILGQPRPPSQRRPQYVESGRVEEFLPYGFFTTPPPGPPKSATAARGSGAETQADA